MPIYKSQTDLAQVQLGQVGIDEVNNVLQTTNGSGQNVPLSNVDVIGDHSEVYAVQDVLDLSSAQTMTDANNNSIVFLNSNSYDASGASSYEFEESDGRLYGLYSRTSGVGQELFFGSAKDIKQQAQLSVYKYSPPWLSGSNWKAAYVLGGDQNGFCLALADYTQAMSQFTMRYVYVRLSTNSLIDVNNHQYVEITQFVRAWINALPNTSNYPWHLPLVRRGVNNTYVYASYPTQAVYLGGFVNDDVTYPFTTAALPASVSTFTPTQITFTKANWYDGSTGSGTALPLTSTASSPVKVVSKTGTVLPVSNWIWPYSNQSTVSPNSSTFEVANNGTTEVMSFISPMYVYYTNSSGASSSQVNQAGFTFVVSGSGASITLTYQTPDGHYGQPYPWFITQVEDGSVLPNEAVVSNISDPTTCMNKLPCTWQYLNNSDAYNQLTFSTFFSGNGSLVRSGTDQVARQAVQYLAGRGGSLAQANLAKFNWMYPNLNVNPRIKSNLYAELTVPSGRINQLVASMMIGANMSLNAGVVLGPDTSSTGQYGLAISTLPAGAQVGARSLYRGSTLLQCFPPRSGEALVKNIDLSDLSYRVGVCYTNGGSINTPVQTFGKSLYWNYVTGGGTKTNATFNIGQFTYDSIAKQWNWPSTASYTYNAAFLTQLQQVATNLKAAAAITSETSRLIELWPVLDSTGSIPTRLYGTLHTTGSNYFRATEVSVGLTLSGSVISINPSDVQVIASSTVNGAVFFSVTNSAYGVAPLYQTFTSTVNQAIAYNSLGSMSYPGNGVAATMAMLLSGTSVSSYFQSYATNAYTQCSVSPQHHGWAMQSSFFGQPDARSNPMLMATPTATIATVADLYSSISAAITANLAPAASNVSQIAVYDLTAVQNNEVLQIGSISGLLNGKIFNLPSTYYDLTGSPTGVYYVYVVDNGMQITLNVTQDNTIAESPTSMYLGTVTKTSGGFTGGAMVSTLVRFGTARLQQGHMFAPISGSCIRWGSYPMSNL